MPRILIVALDSKLREIAFRVAARTPHAVDAVADRKSALRRFAKDDYELVILERGVLISDELPPRSVYLLEESAPIDGELGLESRLLATLGSVGK
ncbi:MAG: hypothetical protein ACKVX7_17780 [Planctomycetota bacterium]